MLRRRELMAFANGAPVLPSGWKECTRIYTKSASTYIDTEYVANGNTTFKAKFSFEDIGGYFFGADSGGGSQMFGIQWSVNLLYPGYGSTRKYFDIYFNQGVFNAGDIMVLDLQKGDWKIYNGDALIVSHDFGYQDFSCDYPFYLFSECRNGSKNGGAVGVSFYGGQIYDGDILMHNLIPCIDDAGIGCLFDSVTQKSYYDAAGVGFNYELK